MKRHLRGTREKLSLAFLREVDASMLLPLERSSGLCNYHARGHGKISGHILPVFAIFTLKTPLGAPSCIPLVVTCPPAVLMRRAFAAALARLFRQIGQ